MIFCQSCLTRNAAENESCEKCGAKLLVLGGSQQWEEPELPRISMEDHFLERISNLEDTVNHILEHLSRLSETVDNLDRNTFVNRSGLTALVDTLKETNLLREELLFQRWESTMVDQMEEARCRERFNQLKHRFIALFRGDPSQSTQFINYIEEADFFLSADRLPESAEVLVQAAALDEQNYELTYYLGEYFHQQGLNREAIHYLQKALAANPDHVDTLLMLGLLFYGENKLKRAESLLKHCVEIQPNHVVALLSLASIFTAQRRFDEAEPLLRHANDQEPQAQGFFLLGLAAREKGKIQRAIGLLRRATELDPNHEDAVFTLGMAYLERGWTRKARECFAHALDLNPDRAEYQEAALGQPDEGPSTHDFDAESMKALRFAESLFRKGKLKQALPHYRQLLKKYPSNYLLLSSYTLLNFSLRRYEETVRMVRKILAQKVPEMVRCVGYTLQMESFRALGRFDEATDSLRQMLKEFPEGNGRAIANYGLAMTKADMGQDLKRAEDLAKEALTMSPPEFRHNVLDALGWVYFKQGRFEEALELLESVVSMHENVNHLYHYGMVLLALNLREEAFKVFERTVKLRNKNAKVDDFIYSAIQKEIRQAMDNQDN